MVVDSFRQSGVAAFLYRKIPIIALPIFCPPSGGQRRLPPIALAPLPGFSPNTAMLGGLRPPATYGRCPPSPRTGGYHAPVLYLTF